MSASYYEVLGVGRDAGEKEIRQAYRRLARQHHPDVNPGNAVSEEKFKQINEANAVLSDPESRRKYDKYGDRWTQADQIEEAEARARRSGFGNFRTRHTSGFNPTGSRFSFGGSSNAGQDDLFDLLFDGRAHEQGSGRRPRTEYPVEITLAEAAEGATRLVNLPDGRRLEVTVPAGVDTGSRVHIPAGSQGDGDFYLSVTVMKHPRFEREGKDLYSTIEVPVADLALGAEVTVPTLQSKVALTIPPGTQNGRRFRLAGQGLPDVNQPNARGSLFATVKAMLPANLTPEETELFRQLKNLRSRERN